MSGDVQPRKRKDKRRKKADSEDTGSSFSSEEHIHVHKDASTGGNICAKILFFCLSSVLLIMIGLILFEYRGSSDEDGLISESKWEPVFAGWLETPSKHEEHSTVKDHAEDDEHGDHADEQGESQVKDDAENDSSALTDNASDSGEHMDKEERNVEVEVQNRPHLQERKPLGTAATYKPELNMKSGNMESEITNKHQLSSDDSKSQDLEGASHTTKIVEQQRSAKYESKAQVNSNKIIGEAPSIEINQNIVKSAPATEQFQKLSEKMGNFAGENQEDTGIKGMRLIDIRSGERELKKVTASKLSAETNEKLKTIQNGVKQKVLNHDKLSNTPSSADEEKQYIVKSDPSSKSRQQQEDSGLRNTKVANVPIQYSSKSSDKLLNVEKSNNHLKASAKENLDVGDKSGANDNKVSIDTGMDTSVVNSSYITEQEFPRENGNKYKSENQKVSTTFNREAKINVEKTVQNEPKPLKKEKHQTSHKNKQNKDDDRILTKKTEGSSIVQSAERITPGSDSDSKRDETNKQKDEVQESKKEDKELENEHEPSGSHPRERSSDDDDGEDLPINAEPPAIKNKQPKSTGGEKKQSYEKADITNGDDWKIIQELDTAEQNAEENPEKAVHLFESILKSYPKSPRALYGKAVALDHLAEKKKSNFILEKAIDAYRQIISLGQLVNDNLFVLAAERCIDRMRFIGSHSRAITVHKILITRFPDNPIYANQLAVTYLMINRLPEAKEVLKDVLRKWPNDGFAQVHYGFILKTGDNNMTEAVKYLQQGIASREPGTIDGRFFFQLGDALMRLGRRKEAMDVNELGVKEGLFLSKYQRSLYNVNRLRAQPWWSPEETTYANYFRRLQAHWKEIRDEALKTLYDSNNNLFKDESENLKDHGNWKQLELFARGRKIPSNCAKAPLTCNLIDEFPAAKDCRRGQVKFSVMDPGTHVWPHCGPTNCRLRSHLGLMVPKGTFIRVAEETRTWEEGKIFIFDDSFEHEVWHNGSTTRLVLITDVWHPELTPDERHSLPAI